MTEQSGASVVREEEPDGAVRVSDSEYLVESNGSSECIGEGV